MKFTREIIQKQVSKLHTAEGNDLSTIKLDSDLAVDIINDIVKKNVDLADVSKQRELLIAFCNYYNEKRTGWNLPIDNTYIDDFLSNLLCLTLII